MSGRTIIVGGVAGGASCAARLRRLDEQAEILVIERGPYVSFANCGLPYHIGGVIADEANVAVALGLIEANDLVSLIDRRPEQVELVLTGRGAPDAVLARADLVTEMTKVKHPFDAGQKGQRGIEW